MFGREFDVFVTVSISKDQEGHLDLSQMNYQHEALLAAQHKVFYRYHSLIAIIREDYGYYHPIL